MKKLISVLFLVIGLVGCGSNSSATEETVVENIMTKEFNFRFWDSTMIGHEKYFKLLDTQEKLDVLVEEMNTLLKDENISKQTIDFEKYNVLVYATKYNAPNELNKYNEYITIDNSHSVEIEQRVVEQTSDEYCSLAIQVRIYKISKSIEKLKLIHEDEVSKVDIYNLNPTNEKVKNIFTGISSENKLIVVHEDNSTYSQNIDINFDKYRVLVVEKPIYTPELIYMTKESIMLVDNTTVKIKSNMINSKIFTGNCIGGTTGIKQILRKVYKVSRDITTVWIGDNILIDMVSGEYETIK